MNSLLKIRAVSSATSLARSTIYRDIRDGIFPRPVKIGKVSAWPATEVAAINAARINGKSEDEIRQLVASIHEQRRAAA